jgi:hypothetical protein
MTGWRGDCRHWVVDITARNDCAANGGAVAVSHRPTWNGGGRTSEWPSLDYGHGPVLPDNPKVC